ncbi:LysR family transcriptional regulator [Undibacterium sp. Ji83W]|uniref:LysR family transcriptional regulator n=1 Tax=Undibacterium sp. Ji83W TaxID=3413043 RepID=UPI003BF15291
MNRQFADVLLGSIELFCMAAELESFKDAANAAGLTPAAVSRSIARLEERIGVRLFVRTTRQLRLTEAGRAYFVQCRQALNQLVEAEREVSGQQIEPAGLVRISMPTPYGHYRVLPLLAKFRQMYPLVKLDLQLSNRNVDFTADGFDLVIRGRNPPDSGMIARRLEDTEIVVCAAPEYLQRFGVPTKLEDLDQHECLQFVLPSAGQNIVWIFRRDGVDIDWPTKGGLTCSEDLLGIITLARHGAGLLQSSRFMVEDDLRAGRMVEVLQEFRGRTRPFSLLYPRDRHLPLRVRVFIDFLIAELAQK